MNTEKLVTIDDTTLTTITGGSIWFCVPAVKNSCPPKQTAPTAPSTTYHRDGLPYATESRL